MQGIPLNLFLDTANLVLYPTDGEFKSLWPADIPITDDEKAQIVNQFYDRLINVTPPQYWLRRWHNLVKRESPKWRKLLDSENLLTETDAMTNYHLKETSTYTSTSSGTSSSTSSGQSGNKQYVSDTPDGSLSDISNYMSSGAESNSTSSGTSSGESGGTSTGQSTTERTGNTGFRTQAELLDNYRESVNYCAFDTIFRTLEPMFIGVWEGEYGYIYPAI